MIPKVIHYCWMSEEKFPELVEKCIDSWKRVLPDYKIKEWNSQNFDFKQNKYCCEAYKNKKWAFVSDYVRLKVLYDEGGIYLDSDIEVFKSFNDLLQEKAFTGFENCNAIGPWIIGSEPNNPLILELLKEYNDRSFILEDKSLDLTPNPVIITPILVKNGLKLNGKTQNLKNITIYSKKYFCPKDFSTGTIELSKENYCIHYFNGGWLPRTKRIKIMILQLMCKYFGKKNVDKIKKIIN